MSALSKEARRQRRRRVIAAVTMTYGLTYLFAAFVVLDLNAAHWSEDSRLAVVVFGSILSYFAALIAVVSQDRDAA